MQRSIFLDTETTGLNPKQGHRVIEIGAVEMQDRTLTGRYYHQYINPEREVEAGAIEVHGITNEFLADKPVMATCIAEFITFVRGAELIIHNAPFDVGFLDHELALCGYDFTLKDICTITDTLAMARKKHPGARATLDALTKRYNITQFNRELHGALLDAEILAQVYLAMTGGQSGFFSEKQPKEKTITTTHSTTPKQHFKIPMVSLSEAEQQAHQARINALNHN